MKKIPMIIIILSCIAISIASVVLSHSNDNTSIPHATIKEPPAEISTHSATVHTTLKATDTYLETNHTETSTSSTESSISENEELYININTADLEALCQLDGIGKAIAMEIIKYRKENDGFKNIKEIMNVYGVGEKIFDKIRNNIYVDAPYSPDKENENSDIPHEESSSNTNLPNEIPLTLDDVAPIELNSADKDLLLYLPYVDENIADLIIALREDINGFSSVYELLYLEELSDEQVAEIAKYVYIEE